MQRDVLRLTWRDFDRAVEDLATQLEGLPITSIYGQFRGGLPLAVALSHRLDLPLIQCPSSKALWVDDIVDSGQTLNQTKNSHQFLAYAAWVARSSRSDLFHSLLLESADWVVFPWEEPKAADKEMRVYRDKRQLLLEV